MLQVDVEHVEARGLGDPRDLDAPGQPHGHRDRDLAARQHVLDVVPQNVAGGHGVPRWRCLAGRELYCPGSVRTYVAGRTIHELRNRLQVSQRPGFARGMAGPGGTRRLLPAGRQLRDDRPDLQPHHRAHSRHRAPADQPLRSAVQGNHRVEPGEDRRRGQHHRQARHRLRHQQIRLRDPRRHPHGAAGREMRAAHPHPRGHRGVGDELRPAAAVADLDPLPQSHRLSRLRGAGGRSRRARADRRGSRARTTR